MLNIKPKADFKWDAVTLGEVRVAGGDSFASGLIYGLMTEQGFQWAVECWRSSRRAGDDSAGDTSTATLAEVERVVKGGTARVTR